MKKLLITVFVLLVVFLAASACAELKIVTTDFVCYDFARAVCGSDADITMLIRPGTEVHTYDPSPSDIIRIAECDVFIYIGGESDEWVDGILESFGDDGPTVVRLFDCVEALEEEETEEMTVHGETGEEVEYDEHIWTSPKNAIRMLRMIETAVAPYGNYSADEYIVEIEAIDREIEALAANSQQRLIVVADRFPLLYMVKEYGLDYAAAFPSCNAESDPSARTVAALIDTVRERNVSVIYVLEMSSGRIARTIAEETGVKVLTYYSMQNITLADFEAGETYVTLMNRNIEALKEGLL